MNKVNHETEVDVSSSGCKGCGHPRDWCRTDGQERTSFLQSLVHLAQTLFRLLYALLQFVTAGIRHRFLAVLASSIRHFELHIQVGQVQVHKRKVLHVRKILAQFLGLVKIPQRSIRVATQLAHSAQIVKQQHLLLVVLTANLLAHRARLLEILERFFRPAHIVQEVRVPVQQHQPQGQRVRVVRVFLNQLRPQRFQAVLVTNRSRTVTFAPIGKSI